MQIEYLQVKITALNRTILTRYRANEPGLASHHTED